MNKNTLQSLLLLAVCILGFASCSDDDSPAPMPTPRTFADVKVDFSAQDISAGTHDERLEFLGGVFWDYRVIAPEVVGNQTYPLVIDLHGASGGASDAHMHTDCYLEEGFDGMDIFMLVPNGGIPLWSDITNQQKVIELLRMAIEFWPIDPDKVVVTGYSNGGNGSWFFGETQPGLFSAAIPMASSYTTTASDGSSRVMPIPMYVIHGEGDELFPVAETETWVDQSVTAGSDITLVIAPGLSHYEPCTYTPYFKEAVEWLKELWK